MNISSTDTKPLPKSGRAKREKFLARASANTGMDRRFMSDGGSKRPDGPVIFCLHRDGNVTYQKIKKIRRLPGMNIMWRLGRIPGGSWI